MTTEAPGIDRDIYPMPMFVTLAVHEHALVDTPWFTRDLVLTDLDGYTVVFTAWPAVRRRGGAGLERDSPRVRRPQS